MAARSARRNTDSADTSAYLKSRRRESHLRLSFPRIIRPERPHIALRIAAGVVASAVFLRRERQQDLGAGILRARVMRVGVVHDQIDGLRAGASLARRLHQPAVIAALDRAEHDHGVSERELGMRNAVALARHHHLPVEAEGLAEEFDRRRRVAVGQAWNDGCPLWRPVRHGRTPRFTD